jgi:hypothetical protein
MQVVKVLSGTIPSVLFDRSMVSAMVHNETLKFQSSEWLVIYPVHQTIFITLIDDIHRTISSEGAVATEELVAQRQNEQERFLKVSSDLKSLGYSTAVLSADYGEKFVCATIINHIKTIVGHEWVRIRRHGGRL